MRNYRVLESLSGRLRELKNKGKDQLIIPKSGRGRLQELLILEILCDNSNGGSN